MMHEERPYKELIEVAYTMYSAGGLPVSIEQFKRNKKDFLRVWLMAATEHFALVDKAIEEENEKHGLLNCNATFIHGS